MSSFVNPVIPGFYPDPSVCRVGEDYYLVTSSFEYFPGIPIFHSRDLVSWRQLGHVLTRRSQLDLDAARSSGGIYAPTIRYHAGRFYVVTTDTTHRGNFYVHTDDPGGEWSEPVLVDQSGIDPSLYFAEDGRVYFQSNFLWWAQEGVYQCEIDLTTGRRLSDSKFLWRGIGAKFPEAPHVYRRSDWFYLLIAEGGTEFGHMVCVARSRTIGGPYESCPRNPVLSHRSTRQSLQSTGHGELIEDHRGRWWLFFLAVRHSGYPQVHHLGRETCLAPVTWENDWPVVNAGQPVGLRLEADLPLPRPWPPAPVRDDFDIPAFAPCWNSRRNPAPGAWSLTDRPGWLALTCLPAGPGDAAPFAFVGRRQQHFECRAETLIDFLPAADHEEAGLIVLMNERHRAELVVTRRAGQRAVLFRRVIGSLSIEAGVFPVPGGPVQLRLQAEEEWYVFSFRAGQHGNPAAGRAETRHLSTEIAGGFTGVYFGVFATANGQANGRTAHFDWFDYEDLTNGDPAQRSLKSAASRPTRLNTTLSPV